MDVTMLTSFDHEAHHGFADAIDADTVNFRSYCDLMSGTPVGDALAAKYWDEADVFMLEGSAPLYAATARRLLWRDQSTFIYLGCDRGAFALSRAAPDEQYDSLFGSFVHGIGSSLVGRVGRQIIDGIIAVSDFIADYARAIFGGDIPVGVVHPYIQPDVYESLSTVEPDLECKRAVTVGRAMEYKGLHLLVKAWPQIREQHPDGELHIVGPGDYPDWYEEIEGVSVLGFVDDLADVFQEASLFVQPSIGDAFPVSTLEAMHAGVPPIVTQLTGTRSEVRAIEGDLVVDATVDSIAEGVKQYFDRPAAEREAFSDKSQERGQRFDVDSQKRNFRNVFYQIYRAI